MDIDEDEHRFGEKPSERTSPRFGDSHASWREVKLFYGCWEAFSTHRTCGAADKYDTRAAPNRQVRRAMEKENNKARTEARRKVGPQHVQALCNRGIKRGERMLIHRCDLDVTCKDILKHVSHTDVTKM